MASQGGSSSGSMLSGAQKNVAQEIKRFLLGTTDESKFPGTLVGQGASPFTGQLIAQLPEEAFQARNLLQETFDPQRFAQSQSAALERALSGESAFDISPEATAELFETGVRAPAIRAFERDIVPTIRENFAAQNALFSTRAGEAVAEAGRDVTLGLDAQLAQAQIGNQRLEAALADQAANRAAGAIPLATALRNEPFAQAQSLAGFGGVFQRQEQNEIDAAFREFIRTAPENDPFTQLALQFTGQGHVTPIPRGPSEGQQIAALALGGLGLAASGGGLFGGGTMGTGTNQQVSAGLLNTLLFGGRR